jgi:hypothetical protein
MNSEDDDHNVFRAINGAPRTQVIGHGFNRKAGAAFLAITTGPTGVRSNANDPL